MMLFFSNAIRKWRRKRLRHVMRGYRHLRNKENLGKIAAIQSDLTNTSITECRGKTSSLIFGQASSHAEQAVRQFLLVRLGGVHINSALLCAIGEVGGKVVFPLPGTWRAVLRNHGMKVAERRSMLLWQGLIFLMLLRGMQASAKHCAAGFRALFSKPLEPGRYVYFDSLSLGNLPRAEESGKNYDVVNWYVQWKGHVSGLESLCHSVQSAPSTRVAGMAVLPIPSPFPPISSAMVVVTLARWCLAAIALAAFDAVRGRWWHAFMLNEAVQAAVVRMQEPARLAHEYLFHNSNWIYRPLWTYDAEVVGSRITFYFYSTNCEPIKCSNDYPRIPFGWEAISWPRYLVWDEYQAEFIKRAVNNAVEIEVVGPIWFHAGTDELADIPPNTVAVFDVQPMRDSIYQPLALNLEYYVPGVTNRFLIDIAEAIAACGAAMALKRKRNIGKAAHPKYRSIVDQFDKMPGFTAVKPDLAATKLIEQCAVVLSMPYTSTALIGREAGKPSAYYDPSGYCRKDDRAAHGIEILSGPYELSAWLKKKLDGSKAKRSADGATVRS